MRAGDGSELAQRGERSEWAGSCWLSAASGATLLVRAGSAPRSERAGWFGLAQHGERSELAGLSRHSAASETSGLVRAGSLGERCKPTGSSWPSASSGASWWLRWLSAASGASWLVRAGSARRAERAVWFGLAQHSEHSEPTGPSWLAGRAKRADWFELAHRGERGELAGSGKLSAASGASLLAGSGWLSAASGASRRVRAGSERRAKRACWFGLAQRGD